MIKFVGLKNCDTCRKAKKWLEAEGFDYEYQDVRADGLNAEDLSVWAGKVGWEALLNRRGTTWRTLDEAQKSDVDEAKAIALMVEHPALMKRPVFQSGDQIILGFKQEQMDALLALK
ncbi:ArsC family reductase [Terasakiella sp. SH-1]|uniref:ArsC family reductase n=1 Tax=Terasakiella sp. SH-1 TaxID=2560057 RepID=UPI001073F7C2|nr:ArsC family reductase [Terasakiella sp. SH-1]